MSKIKLKTTDLYANTETDSGQEFQVQQSLFYVI